MIYDRFKIENEPTVSEVTVEEPAECEICRDPLDEGDVLAYNPFFIPEIQPIRRRRLAKPQTISENTQCDHKVHLECL